MGKLKRVSIIETVAAGGLFGDARGRRKTASPQQRGEMDRLRKNNAWLRSPAIQAVIQGYARLTPEQRKWTPRKASATESLARTARRLTTPPDMSAAPNPRRLQLRRSLTESRQRPAAKAETLEQTRSRIMSG